MSRVQVITHGDIVEIALARPPVNALDPALCRELRAALESAIVADARGVILSGSAGIFSAGLDVPHLLGLGDDRDALVEAWQAFFAAARAIATCPVPVAAAITGHSPAGGCVLALCCDYRVMAEGDFRIGLNEVRVGLVAPEGIQRLMRRAVGTNCAERLLVSGEMVASDRALHIGLVDELAEVDLVTVRALAWMRELLSLPRDAVLQTRRIARADVVEALQNEHIELDRFVDGWFEPGTQAALRALVERLGK